MNKTALIMICLLGLLIYTASAVECGSSPVVGCDISTDTTWTDVNMNLTNVTISGSDVTLDIVNSHITFDQTWGPGLFPNNENVNWMIHVQGSGVTVNCDASSEISGYYDPAGAGTGTGAIGGYPAEAANLTVDGCHLNHHITALRGAGGAPEGLEGQKYLNVVITDSLYQAIYGLGPNGIIDNLKCPGGCEINLWGGSNEVLKNTNSSVSVSLGSGEGGFSGSIYNNQLDYITTNDGYDGNGLNITGNTINGMDILITPTGNEYIYGNRFTDSVYDGSVDGIHYCFGGLGNIYLNGAEYIGADTSWQSCCTPNWQCTSYGDQCIIRPYNHKECLSVSDANFCGRQFTGDLANYASTDCTVKATNAGAIVFTNQQIAKQQQAAPNPIEQFILNIRAAILNLLHIQG